MNNRVLLAALAGGVAMFLAGWVVYGMLLMDTMREMNPGMAGISKEPPVMWALIISNLLWGLVYALIFSRWAGINTLQGGAIAGAWLSALISLSLDLSFYGMSTIMTLNWMVVDVVASTVLGAVGGAAIGWVLGYGSRP
ncbi:MAG: hypothetical protein IPM81_13090 [Saprospirales bacterium]|nr:hypothetical protein [Saprospirales bacterium]